MEIGHREGSSDISSTVDEAFSLVYNTFEEDSLKSEVGELRNTGAHQYQYLRLSGEQLFTARDSESRCLRTSPAVVLNGHSASR